ncbi:sericin-2, partial [Penaeus vannamei]|uniref:sericin-2 n=1 Tax=Penaeus vannamei TaxID=6689 RepID=UPI00387F4BA0
MDDDMEDEIIYELFTAHAHILWRYLGVTTAGLIELVIPGPGESMKMKIFQPGPFMFLIFLVIVASVVLQSSSHLLRQWMVRLCYVLGLNSVTDSGLKNFGGIELVTGSIGSDNVSWEFKDGIVGVYSMQGRRGNMEDRFSVIQDEDVGEKKMSFFGVFDGHGGQYTADFVKDHLFKNTIDKIKQLRSQASIAKNGNNNIPGTSSKNTNGNGKSSTATSKISTPSSTTATLNSVNKKSSSSSTSSSEAESAKKSSTSMPLGKAEECVEKAAESGSSSSTSNSEGNNNSQSDKDLSVEEKGVCPGSGVETISQPSSGSISSSSPSSSCHASTSAKPEDPEVSSKKDDLYNSVSLKKRNSVSGSSANGNNNNNNSNSNGASKEKKDDSSSSSSSSSS